MTNDKDLSVPTTRYRFVEVGREKQTWESEIATELHGDDLEHAMYKEVRPRLSSVGVDVVFDELTGHGNVYSGAHTTGRIERLN